MKKRIVCLLLALVMVLGLCLNGCNNDAKPEETKGQDVPKETQGNAKETEATEKQLEEKTERWVYLNDLAERIAQQ